MTVKTHNRFPLVSIVTPAFNQGNYLEATIESVLNQDYPNLEYIIIDDGSTDNTPDIIQKYAGSVRSVRHENIGQSRTLNKGWAMSRGELVGYISSDDLLAPAAVSRAVAALVKDPEVMVSYSDFGLIDADGKLIKNIQTGEFSERRLVEEIICQPGPGCIFRKSLLQKIGYWNPCLKQIPDFEFWLRASQVGGFARVPEVLALSRIHTGSASFSPVANDRSDEIVKVMADFWETYEPNYCQERSLAWASLVAAKSHFQSGRYAKGLKSAFDATIQYPKVAFEMNCWRALVSGLSRRMYYQIASRV